MWGQQRGTGPVHLESQHLSVVLGKPRQIEERGADLFQGLLDRHLLGQTVGADLDPGGTHVLGEDDVVFRRGHVGAELCRIGRVVVEGTAEAHEFYGGIGKPLPDLGPCRGIEGHLDPMAMGRAEFHALETGCRAVLEDRRDIPVLGEVVGHEAQLEGGAGKLLRRVGGHRPGRDAGQG